MYYTVYKITSKKDGKIYIGVHKTDDLNDGYMGSGTRIINAIQKYGTDSFTKEILYCYDCEKDALLMEKNIVDEDFIKDPKTFNLVTGGGMPPSRKNISCISSSFNLFDAVVSVASHQNALQPSYMRPSVS